MLLILLQFLVAHCAQIQPRFHTVELGETLSKIASLYVVPLADVTEKNAEILKAGIRPGLKLFIPFEESPEWDRAIAHEMKKVEYDVPPVMASFPGFIWPVVGYVSSNFGNRQGHLHEGIDIVASEGTGVRASRSGHVIYAHNRIGGYGNMVIVRHPDSYSTVYAHLSSMSVRKGQFISKGQVLGRVGQTGHSRGPHLHFEVRNNRVPVNPLLYLQVHIANNIVKR